MIGPLTDYAALCAAAGLPEGVSRYIAPLTSPDASEIVAHADVMARRHGIVFQREDAVGRHLETEMPDGSRRKLLRVARYAFARPDEVLDAATAIIEAVARDCGPGRAWSLAGHVHAIGDGSTPSPAVTWVDIGSVPHVCIRSWICHENGPRTEEGPAPAYRDSLFRELRAAEEALRAKDEWLARGLYDGDRGPMSGLPVVTPPPTVEVHSCHDCPCAEGTGGYGGSGRCRLSGIRINTASRAPAGCPLRSGPVALRFVDRDRP